MELTTAIKKAEKLSGKKVTVNGQQHTVIYKGYVVGFSANGRIESGVSATCYHTKRVGEMSDSMTDYFPGTFHDNITQAFHFVDIRTSK